MIRKSRLTGKRKKRSWSVRRRIQRNKWELELDAECRQRVYDRDQTCQLRLASTCTGDQQLQWCHCITREEKCLRWDELNTFMACQNCHTYWHTHIGQAMLYFQSTWPERWEHIKRVLAGSTKFGYEGVKALHEETFGVAEGLKVINK